MADFAPPPGPPPPVVPEGWKAQFDSNYKEWFYVNLLTEKSQWERPTVPATTDFSAPPAPRPDEQPPSYLESEPAPSSANPTGDSKTMQDPVLGSNNPYYSHGSGQPSPAPPMVNTNDDERLAAQLQAEEDARAAAASQQRVDGRSPIPGSSTHGHDAGASSSHSLPPRPEDDRGRSSGGRLLGKLLGKAKAAHSSGSSPSPFSRPPPGLQQPGYGYGHQPANPYMQGGAGYYPAHPSHHMGGPYGYGGYGGAYGGYPPQMMGRRPGHRPGGGGMGTGGAAALGLGGGLLGGAMLANAMDDDYGDGYEDGFDAGGGDDGGGD
ncbi:hypothetical protein FQN54_007701 [Arachnomyces sp. PD_36]|nr:hypothetical protein FQN54_007701 [Arachnomyces sp. PD_36]